MIKNKRKIGSHYEHIAGEYLVSQGYEILEYNFYSRGGEIDIIAKHGDYYVFIEVKYRENFRAGYPIEFVTANKQRKLSKSAWYYLYKNNLCEEPVRFDVVGICGTEIQLIQNAFEFAI